MPNPEDSDHFERRYRTPYSSNHPVPTVQQYKSDKENISASHEGDFTHHRLSSKHVGSSPSEEAEAGDAQNQGLKGTSEDVTLSQDPNERRKEQKHRNEGGSQRVVTDPVTHLPITIRDFTESDLDQANTNREDDSKTQSGTAQVDRLNDVLQISPPTYRRQALEQEIQHHGMDDSFPEVANPRHLERFENNFESPLRYFRDIVPWMGAWLHGLDFRAAEGSAWTLTKFTVTYLFLRGALNLAYQTYQKRAVKAWEDSAWERKRIQDAPDIANMKPESTIWLNYFLSYVWPIVNPDLFTSLVDTVEDVMQASLPKFVRMVSIEDLGQGSEPLRILGIKCLPPGAASKSLSSNGEIKSKQPVQQGLAPDSNNDDSMTKSREIPVANDQTEEQDLDQADHFEAEEGEFVNLEIAFAYRPRGSKRKKSDREKNAHLYMAFYLVGGIKVPVWVELEGLVGTIRTRVQLTPDAPFIALCTFTFLGQPRVQVSCVPLVKKGLNIMDLPFLSNFVQSSVDAAMAQYVAPKSMTLDLKSILAGDDFKHDTDTRGILIVRIHRAYDFKDGDMGIPLIRTASSDSYVSVGWAKFGKVLFSTRVILAEKEPHYEETAHLLVGPQELDADESLRLQLWDSDRVTADDDLGKIEVDLKELMNDEKTKGRMCQRTDPFKAIRAGETMPGRLQWSVGYFAKARLLDSQVANNPPEPHITTVEQLKTYSFQQSARKLRESNRDESSERDQLKTQDFEERCTELITTSVPSQIYPSGILSVQVHQITGLKLESLSRSRDEDGGEVEDAEEEAGEDLPDSFVTISINHQKVFKTRTKPKSSKPFFNAGTERFIRDWRTTTIFITARDARVHEDNPLLGTVYLPLGTMLRSRTMSRFNGFFPLAGGVGYGRIRLSVVFRSVAMQPPPRALGWEWGTLEVGPNIECDDSLPSNLRGHKISFSTPLGRGKAYSQQPGMFSSASEEEKPTWMTKRSMPLRLPVRNRYSVPLVVEIHSSSSLSDSTLAFGVLWLQNIPDEEDIWLTIPMFQGDLNRAKANILPESEMGEKLGAVKVKLRFWRGLSRWHGRLGKKSGDVMDMMEVLDCAHDAGLVDELVGDDEWLSRHDGQGQSRDEDGTESSTESSSDDDNDSEDGEKDSKDSKGETAKETSGFMNELKGYKKHKGQLHRRHRGVMQWKGPRIFQSMKSKAEHTVERMTDMFDHHSREPDVETEV